MKSMENNATMQMEYIPVIPLSDKNSTFFVDDQNPSLFDATLKNRWQQAEKNGVLRYKLRIEDSKLIQGRYQFVAQLNSDRGQKRRSPEIITSMDQPFDPSRFNFSNLPDKEILMRLGDQEDMIAVNVSPIEFGHSLLVTKHADCLPQVITKHSLRMAVELFLLSHSPYLRVAFNSLCAYASVNHLHWHIYYFEHRMLLESIELDDFVGPVKILRDYPGRGFCLRSRCVNDIEELVSLTFLIVNRLQEKRVAHNVYVTRERDEFEKHTGLRIYVWPRKSYEGAKDARFSFVPAVCELFGHLLIGSREIFESLNEEDVSYILRDITVETFDSVVEDLQELIKGWMDKPKNIRS